jgi:hypothetical protein
VAVEILGRGDGDNAGKPDCAGDHPAVDAANRLQTTIACVYGFAGHDDLSVGRLCEKTLSRL